MRAKRYDGVNLDPAIGINSYMTTISIKDAAGASQNILAKLNSDGSSTFYHAQLNTLPSGVTPLVGTTTTTTTSAVFSPALQREIVLTTSGTWAGSVQLLRSVDSGATKLPVTVGGAVWASYTANVNEIVAVETESGAEYYLRIVITTGSMTYRLAQ
jgi:hypothetical protein